MTTAGELSCQATEETQSLHRPFREQPMLEYRLLMGNALTAIKQQDAQQAKLGLGIDHREWVLNSHLYGATKKKKKVYINCRAMDLHLHSRPRHLAISRLIGQPASCYIQL